LPIRVIARRFRPSRASGRGRAPVNATPVNANMDTPSASPASAGNALVRALGVSDVTWLYLVAVVNLNVVLVPQGISVIELANGSRKELCSYA
jgi:hypothetical protein